MHLAAYRSTMRRRSVLAALGTATVGVAAGCTALPGDDPATTGSRTDSRSDTSTVTATTSGDPPSGEPTSTGTDGSTPTPTDCEMTLFRTDFEVLSTECGTGRNAADATVDSRGTATPSDGGTRYVVRVDGTIDGSDTCHSARLVAAETVRDGDALRVAVESHVPESNEGRACGDCIVDVDYRVTAEYRCEYPDIVEVVHDGEQIAEIPLPE